MPSPDPMAPFFPTLFQPDFLLQFPGLTLLRNPLSLPIPFPPLSLPFTCYPLPFPPIKHLILGDYLLMAAPFLFLFSSFTLPVLLFPLPANKHFLGDHPPKGFWSEKSTYMVVSELEK